MKKISTACPPQDTTLKLTSSRSEVCAPRGEVEGLYVCKNFTPEYSKRPNKLHAMKTRRTARPKNKGRAGACSDDRQTRLEKAPQYRACAHASGETNISHNTKPKHQFHCSAKRADSSTLDHHSTAWPTPRQGDRRKLKRPLRILERMGGRRYLRTFHVHRSPDGFFPLFPSPSNSSESTLPIFGLLNCRRRRIDGLHHGRSCS